MESEKYQIINQIGLIIRQSHQRHTAIFQSLSYDKKITPIQFTMLCTISDHGPSSLTEILKYTAIDHATIRGVVDRLKKRNLIELKNDTKDQRKVLVLLTPEGDELVKNMIPSAVEITKKTLENLNAGEQVALKFLLEKMNNKGDYSSK
jgi:DNA-binding MarR family transcriptional regulator